MKEKIKACGSKRRGGCPLGGDDVFVVKVGDKMFYVKMGHEYHNKGTGVMTKKNNA